MTSALPPLVENSAQAYMDLERDYLLQTYARYPLVLSRGKGAYLYDLDGRRYLDFLTGYEQSLLLFYLVSIASF